MARKQIESTIYRRKLLNAVLFFAKKIKRPNTTTISKLLCFFDFQHFKETGYPSIGLKYYSFPKGPVPRDFWLEVKDGKVPEDFKGFLSLNKLRDDYDPDYKEIEFIAEKSPDLSIFTPREQRILNELTFMFGLVHGRAMSVISHEKGKPWDITIKEKGSNKLIDYMLALDDKTKIDKEEAFENLKEHFEVVNNFDLTPIKK